MLKKVGLNNQEMHLKVVLFFFIMMFIVISLSAFYFVRKYYLSYNFLRLDPLEDSNLNKDLLQTPKNTRNIWLIGDSRVSRWDINLLLPLNANIINLGIEGQTSSQVYGRLRSYLEIGNPDWILLEAGINDLKVIGLNKKYADRIIESCFANISNIAELCLDKNINLVIINILPEGNIEFSRRLVWNSSVGAAVNEVNNRLEGFCKNYGILFFDTSPFLCDEKKKIKKDFQDGALHLNYEGYKILSRHLINEIGVEINSTLIHNN